MVPNVSTVIIRLPAISAILVFSPRISINPIADSSHGSASANGWMIAAGIGVPSNCFSIPCSKTRVPV